MNETTANENCDPPRPKLVTLHDGCPQPRPDWVPDAANGSFATWVMQGVRPTGAVAAARVPPRRRTLTTEDYVQGVLARDPSVLARAITLIESNAAAHQGQAQQVLARLLPHTGTAYRVGLTCIPGAGKAHLSRRSAAISPVPGNGSPSSPSILRAP